MPLFENCVYDLYIWWILKHTCRVAVCEAESLVSKYMYICFDCLVRIFWRAAAHVGDRGVVTWHDFTWRGRGYIILLPPTPRLGRARTRTSFGLRACSVGRVQHADFIWCMGAWPPPHPLIGSRTCATIHQYNFQFSIVISNLNVKSEFQTAGRWVGAWSWPHPLTWSGTCALHPTYVGWSKLWHHILDVGSGGVHGLDLAWHLVVGRFSGWPPSHWLGCARTLSSAHLKLNIQFYWSMYSKARGRMGMSLRAWHTGVGVDNCQPPRPLMGRARIRTRIHRPLWAVKTSI